MTGSYVLLRGHITAVVRLFHVLRSSVVALPRHPIEWSIYVTSFYAYSHSKTSLFPEDRGSQFPSQNYYTSANLHVVIGQVNVAVTIALLFRRCHMRIYARVAAVLMDSCREFPQCLHACVEAAT